MGKYPRHCVKPISPYSPTYHLSRKVLCVDCNVELHKNQDFVLHGSRCPRCWEEYVQLCNAMKRYTVYVWLSVVDSVEADVVMDVSATVCDEAVQRVMTEQNIPYAYYVWAVPFDEMEEDVGRFDVFSSVQEVCAGER